MDKSLSKLKCILLYLLWFLLVTQIVNSNFINCYFNFIETQLFQNRFLSNSSPHSFYMTKCMQCNNFGSPHGRLGFLRCGTVHQYL